MSQLKKSGHYAEKNRVTIKKVGSHRIKTGSDLLLDTNKRSEQIEKVGSL